MAGRHNGMKKRRRSGYASTSHFSVISRLPHVAPGIIPALFAKLRLFNGKIQPALFCESLRLINL